MARRRKRKLPKDPIAAEIQDLSHDGRGVAVIEDKTTFIHGALPGEQVMVRLTDRFRRYDEGETVEILEASPDRIDPRCPHFGQCGGCSLQHLSAEKQIEFKHNTLVQNLVRIGKVEPLEFWEPITGPAWGYRRKARLSCRYVHKKERVLVGFRERYGRFVADMSECHVLDERIARCLPDLAELVGSMEAKRSIPQIEVACGDDQCALIFRHVESLEEPDLQKLSEFSQTSGLSILLQPKGPDTIHSPFGEAPELSFSLPDYGLRLVFGPADFIQVNAEMNHLMIRRALDLLQAEPGDRVLDLFCGLGNFTLPIATHAGSVVGVEGDRELVAKGQANAERNGISNAQFYMADLTEDPGAAPWLKEPYDKALVDPPRSGAEFILPHLAGSGAERLVYVSCHPASLARDAGILVEQFGFRLMGAGVMDMFPHTGHVESIALFERNTL